MNLYPVLKRPVCPTGALHAPVNERTLKKDYITLSRFINSYKQEKSTSSFQFPQLMMAIQTAAKCVATTLKKSGFAQASNSSHICGRKLEHYLNEIIINQVASTNTVCLIICKDYEDAIKVETKRFGKYIFAFSAIDAQTHGNTEYSSSVGSTFAIYRKNESHTALEADDKDGLQAGKSMLCGGYILYGYCTVMVLAFNGGSVNGFTLDNAVGEFMLSDPMMRIPSFAKVYSINEGYAPSFDPGISSFIENLKVTKLGDIWTARYSGNLVGDVHRILKSGGIFMYPATKEYPGGKQRLLYEAAPIAFIFKQAGGLAINNKQFILEVVPQKLHEKTPFFCGSKENIVSLMRSIGMTKQIEDVLAD